MIFEKTISHTISEDGCSYTEITGENPVKFLSSLCSL